MNVDTVLLSNYARCLKPDVLNRYKLKLNYLKIDPFLLRLNPKLKWKTIQNNEKDMPTLEMVDIFHYFVYHTSWYTKKEFRAYKSLEGYNFFISSHVKELKWLDVTSGEEKIHVVLSKVQHSLRTNEDLLEVWILLKISGEIQSAHCTCMAGLSESCSHIAAICFLFNYFTEKKNSTSVTDQPAYWVAPGGSNCAMNVISPKEIEKISYCNAKNKRVRKQLDFDDGLKKIKVELVTPRVNKVTVLQKLHQFNKTSQILTVELPHCRIMSENLESLPKCLTKLYTERYEDESLDRLVEIGKALNFALSKEDIMNIESGTRRQSKSGEWFRYRTGRITASKSFQVCRVKANDSNPSLIKSICYPQKNILKVAATEWGCKHESIAAEEYLQEQKKIHKNLIIEQSGFHINKSFPFLGASPDAIVNCDCCGRGVLEVKCPLCLIIKSIDELHYLNTSTGKLALKRDHSYFYQIQTQLLCVKNVKYADFFIWSSNETHTGRYFPDSEVQNIIIQKSRKFFYYSILPELLAKYYSRHCKQKESANMNSENTEFPFCFCKNGAIKGKMLLCTKQGCVNLQYHYKCLGIKRVVKNFVCKMCCPAEQNSTEQSMIEQKSTDAAVSVNETEDTPFPYCSCRNRNIKGKMLACTKEDCVNVKYHYKCLGIRKIIKNFVCVICCALDCSNPGTSGL